MNIYKLTLQYKGTHYHGFQIQPSGATIQGELHRALSILSKSDEIKTIGSGRTDAGVHALGQVVKIEIPVSIPVESLPRAINSHLPHDIRVIQAEISTPEFHPIFSAKSKEYNYVFTTAETVSPFARELVGHFPGSLNLALMREGCAHFCGEHDFKSFQCTGTEVATSIRRIYECEIIEHKGSGHFAHLLPEYYVLRVVGNGFLKQMVRLMMGALFNLGREKITSGELKAALTKPIEERLGPTSPPEGLYLVKVHY